MRTKKALLAALCAALLVVGSVMGTMAYLTSSDSVTNTFTVGNVKITLDEARSDVNGVAADMSDRVEANKYHLMPGHKYTKDPTIHVDAASENCYLFVKVANGIEAIEAKGEQVGEDISVADQMAALGWEVVDADNGIYSYERVVTKNENIKVFEYFTVMGSGLDNTGIDAYKTAEIVVTAYAIQADGFADMTAAQIWAAYDGTK